MWKIQSCEVCEFCILLYYAEKSVTTFRKCGNAFPRVIQKYTKIAASHVCIFHILRYFSTKLHNFTKFMMLFPAVLMNFPNSEVCLIGEWSIGDTAGRKFVGRPVISFVLLAFLGAIIPMRELEQYIGELHSQGKQNPITFCIYPGRNNKYTLYLDDDGKTRNAETEQLYRVTDISHEGIQNGQRVRVKRLHDKYKPPETFYYVALLGSTAPKSVKLGGTVLSKKTGESDSAAASALAESKVDAYYHNGFLQTTYIKVFDQKADVTIEAKF